jgi:hypothetical protein
MNRCTQTVLLACLLFLVGCGNRITKDNYAKIKTGMTIAEVESILGRGTEQGSSNASFGGISLDMKSIVWQDDIKIISVTFSNGKVQAKSQIGL